MARGPRPAFIRTHLALLAGTDFSRPTGQLGLQHTIFGGQIFVPRQQLLSCVHRKPKFERIGGAVHPPGEAAAPEAAEAATPEAAEAATTASPRDGQRIFNSRAKSTSSIRPDTS